MESALQVKDLCKSYKGTNFKLQNVSFTIPKGSIMGFVGKNGAGKSTAINTILNIIQKRQRRGKFLRPANDRSFHLPAGPHRGSV